MSDKENREVINKLAKGAGITAFGMFFSKAVTYFYRAIVGRALGPEAYGQLNIGIMIVGIATTFSGDALRNGIKKFIPEYREADDLASIKGTVISALELNLIGAIIVSGTVFLSAEFIAVNIFQNTDLIPIIKVMGLVPLIERPYDILIDTTLAYNEAKYQVISTNIVQNLVQLATTVLLIIFLSYGVMGAVWGWVAGVVLTLPLAFYFVEKKIGPIITSKVKAKKNRKELFKFSYPLMLSGMVGIFLGWTDTAFLGYFMDDTAVGLYNAAFPTALLLMIPLQAIGQLSLPSMSEIKAKDKSQKEMLKTTSRWATALTFPTFLLMALFSSELIILLFGRQYETAGIALTILAFGNLVNSSTGYVNDILKSNGFTRTILYINVANLIANVILNILLIPRYGINGAAIATASSTIILNILLLIQAYRYEKIHPFSRKMIYSVIAGAASLAITYLVFKQIFTATPYWALLPAGILFYLVYLVVFIRIGGLTDYDREILLTIGRKAGKEELVEKALSILRG